MLRRYSHDHKILYELVAHLPADAELNKHTARLLEDPCVAEVHGRNRTDGRWAFTARRHQ